MSFTTAKGSNRATGLCRLRASADMSIYGAAANHRCLLTLLDQYSSFEVDLSQVDEIDSSGIQVLLAATRQAERAQKTFRLHSPSPPVDEVLRLLDLREQFDWIDPPN